MKTETDYRTKTYEVTIGCACDADPEPYYRVEIVKGKSEEAVRKKFEKKCLKFNVENNTESSCSPYKFVYDVREV